MLSVSLIIMTKQTKASKEYYGQVMSFWYVKKRILNDSFNSSNERVLKIASDKKKDLISQIRRSMLNLKTNYMSEVKNDLFEFTAE